MRSRRVAVSALGVPRYWFHLAGTAGFLLGQLTAQRALEADITALHIGTLGLVVEPMATELERVAASLPGTALLLLDPNCRPQVIPDADAYRARIWRILARADLVPVRPAFHVNHVEDLAFLVPGASVPDAARALLAAGARAVLVTDGPAMIRAFAGNDHLAVPVPPAEAAARISPIPFLVVHGDKDVYLPVEHAYQLYEAAREPKELWVVPGFGHAESGSNAGLVDRIGSWVREVTAPRQVAP